MHSSDFGRSNYYQVIGPYQCQNHDLIEFTGLAGALWVQVDSCLIVGMEIGYRFQRQAETRLSLSSREGLSRISVIVDADP